VVCVPSRFEAGSHVVIEALACGSPVLAFDLPSLRGFVPLDACELISCFDVRAYARTLQLLLSDPTRCRTMGLRGREFASDFEWDAIAARHEAAYRRIVGAHQR
jgi:glycosyltransferase involved in cell wall biosynthesis